MVEKNVVEFEPDYVFPPGETLRETLEAIGMTQVDLAMRIGRPKKTISEIVNGKTQITPDTALQLERALGVPASLWINMEQSYRQFLARRSEEERLKGQIGWLKRFPWRKMVARGYIEKMENPVSQLRAILNFFGLASFDQWEPWLHALKVRFRKSSAFKSDLLSLAAWLRRGQTLAQDLDCSKFDADKFQNALFAIRPLTREEIGIAIEKARKLCAECGVALVLVPALPGCRLSGAARWLAPNKALIQLTLRYKRDDFLWFALFHEAAHILQGRKRPIFVDEKGQGKEDLEDQANLSAANYLLPSKAYLQFVAHGLFTRKSIVDFAERMQVAPGIVVGRLQHDKYIPYNRHISLTRPLRWAHG